MRLIKTQLLNAASLGKTCCISITLWIRYHCIYQPTYLIMQTSKDWLQYFSNNLQQKRIDWSVQPSITNEALKPILKSIQAWQLGETSDGSNLINVCTRYAKKINDPCYIGAMRLFIKEEQKHGNNLGRYLDLVGKARIKKNWGDSLFRKARHINTSMQWFTLAVITVESAAQIFYQCLKDATDCKLLQQICTDILIDEAPHIQFQQQRLQAIIKLQRNSNKWLSITLYKMFFYCTALVIWVAHKNVFKAGDVNFKKYSMKMKSKYDKTIGRLDAGDILSDKKELVPVYYKNKHGFFDALYYSFQGMCLFFQFERNGKIQLVIAAATIAAAALLGISAAEWITVLVCVGMVIGMEMLNSALEQLCNKVESGYDPVIKAVKDIAAGAVLFASIISIAIGVIIFLPKLLQVA